MDNIFQLDESARQLFSELGGLDKSDHANADTASGIFASLDQEEKILDYYRLLMAQATCLFAEILVNSSFTALQQENEEKIKLFVDFLKRIAKAPKFDGKICCRLRGQQCPPAKEDSSESYDYELSFGNFLLDYQVAQIVEEREGGKGAVIYAKLMEAFKAMSVMDIFNFSIDFGAGEEPDYQKIENTFKHLSRFYAKKNSKDRVVVHDEYNQPHINLTLLSSTNNVKSSALQNLVNKIKPLVLEPKPGSKLNNFATVYDAILASKKYRAQLKKMPIEVNNVQWLTKTLQNDPAKIARAVQVSRLVLAKYGSNPKMASEVMTSINSEGYSRNIRADVMGKRLSLATNFIDLAEESNDKQDLQKEALGNIEVGLDQLGDEVFDSIAIDENNEVSSINEDGQHTTWSIHDKILDLLSFFKQRSTTKKKIRDITNKNIQFGEKDYAVIAKNFKITELEASHLVDLLRSCFDDHGRFRRVFFEKNIVEFVQYESKVFEFLWHYLKELETRQDRVSFLNALQLLVAKLQRPQDAINILLADVFNGAPDISYSDRNGLILAIILLRYRNKEARSNVEHTPEEVLLVRKGLNEDMVNVVKGVFEKNQESVIQKVKIITKLLFEASAKRKYKEDEFQPRCLLYLLRELVVFLALIGDSSSQAIVRGMAQEFGNPASPYYTNMDNKDNLRYSLLFLQVVARALKRFGEPQSEAILDEVSRKTDVFLDLSSDPAHQQNVKKVMARIIND